MNTHTVRWFLKIGSAETFRAYPLYGDSVSVDWEQDSGQKYFRQKFNGKLKFIGADYDAIMAGAFDARIVVSAFSYNLQGNSAPLFDGHFYKADCEIDEDAHTIEVAPSTDDAYQKILDGWEKEFNLVKLAPEIVPLNMVRRPVLQIYNVGRSTVTCILSGMAWEQDCEAVNDPTAYWFTRISQDIALVIYSIYQKNDFDWGGMTPVPSTFRYSQGAIDNKSEVKDGYYVKIYPSTGWVTICDANDDSVVWQNNPEGELPPWPWEFELFSTEPGMSGNKLVIQAIRVVLYARVLCDVDEIDGMTTKDLPADDFVSNLPGYRKVLPYNFGQEGVAFEIKEQMSNTPTEYGVSAGGHYYIKPVYPASSGYGEILPICRSSWDEFSIWWLTNGNPVESTIEADGRKPFTLRDSYPLHSVISVLLNEINAGISFSNTSAYSEFFYGNAAQAIRGDDDTQVFITPKSNLIAIEYENAAQRGNITLKQVLDMLKNVYRCFWFVENGKLRIEHAAFFARGGNYVGPMGIGLDLTNLYYTRSGKIVAEGQQTYKYDKPETYSRIEFSWMDDVTSPFEGAINILSNYVLKEKKEEVNISQFTSDLDYILLNPGDISKDGFVLLGASFVGGAWKVPMVEFDWPGSNEVQSILQNGYLAFKFLTRYYMYDLCAPDYEIDGESGTAQGVVPLKTQDVIFPGEWSAGYYPVPDTFELVKTLIGNGQIRKMSLNITSLTIKATLNYAAS